MPNAIDYAAPEQVAAWLHHPVVGDPSFDGFVRQPGNPVLTGRPPYEWTVNGSIFLDPPTGDLYLYVGLYPRGYWPAGGCQALVSHDRGTTWTDLGIVLRGSADLFDGDGENPGATPDVTVVYHDRLYHMLYDWADRKNSRGGIAYAVAKHSAGPFVRAMKPIHVDSEQEPILGRYVRMYAATLLRRRHDWLILAMMSTPGNAGGTWALVALTANDADGPYSEPRLLLYPQSGVFHPAPVEFFPCFAHQGRIYAPATSVAKNRSYQVLFSADIEVAHRPEVWKIVSEGSVWHDEPVPNEAMGIWGQTFSGLVDDGGTLYAVFPSKTADDVGTINIASRLFDQPQRRGFVLSAPNTPGLGILQRTLGEFRLECDVVTSGMFALLWGHTGPIGPERHFGADGTAHPKTFSDTTKWELTPTGWLLSAVDGEGGSTAVASGNESPVPGERIGVSIEQGRDRLRLTLGGSAVWDGALPAKRGRIGVRAHRGSIVRVDRFLLSPAGDIEPVHLLATDATMGSGANRRDWRVDASPVYRFGVGCVSARPGATAKWNYRGRGFRLWSPRGPEFGSLRLIVDGKDRGVIHLESYTLEETGIVAEDATLDDGYHAVKLVAEHGTIPCDALEFVPTRG